jgi:hypothetical protein
MILPRHAPPVLRVSSHLRPSPAARPGGFAVGRSFWKCERLEWTQEAGTRCTAGRIEYGTVYEIARFGGRKLA